MLGCNGLQSLVRKASMPSARGTSYQGTVTVCGRITRHALKQLPSWHEVEGRRFLADAGHFSMIYPARRHDGVGHDCALQHKPTGSAKVVVAA